MAANGALPSYAAADLTSGLGQLKVSPDIEKLLREQSTSQSSGQPAVAASPPRPPAASPTAAASSNEASQPSASLPRAGSSTSLAPAAAAAQGQPAGQPAAPPSPERGQGVRTSQPFQSGESESVKESRRTVLSHDEEVRAVDDVQREAPPPAAPQSLLRGLRRARCPPRVVAPALRSRHPPRRPD